MAKFQCQFDTEHPVLFLYDPAFAEVTPPDLRDPLAAITEKGISFCVLPYVDGASEVTISDKDCDRGGTLYASGMVTAPSGVLALTDSASFRYINIPVPKGSQAVEVWADSKTNPDWVWIKLHSIRQY